MAADRHGSWTGPLAAAGSSRSGPPWAGLLEALPAAFYVDRTDGTSVWVSSHVESIMGLTEQEWASGYDRWVERVHPKDRDRVVDANRRFLESGRQEPESDEYRVVLPDGRVRWIHERALLLADAESGELLVHGVLVDVTEERTSLEVAERVGGLFRTLVEHSREAVTIVDERGVVLYQNPSMGRVVDRPPEWFEGKTPLDLMHPRMLRGAARCSRSCTTTRALSCPGSSGCAIGTARGALSRGSPPTSSTIPPWAASSSTTAT